MRAAYHPEPRPKDTVPTYLHRVCRALEWIKKRSGSCIWLRVAGPFAQLRPRDPGCSGLPSQLLNVTGDFVDVGEQAAGRLTIETSCRD